MRAYNFSAGPALLPDEVLEQAQAELLDYAGTGTSIMEQSHRGKHYDAVHTEAIENTRKLLAISDDYAVLLLQGGATGQFAMVPMNLLGDGQVADYTNSGSWAAKAVKEAQLVGQVNVAADTSKASPARMPTADELKLTDGAAYVHITSNETISGVQWKRFPETVSPLIADMSSDILSRPMEVSQFGIIYAGAQKNLGPAGVVMTIVRKDLVQNPPANLPLMYRYATHIEKNSLYNTPPTFSIYLVALVTRWLLAKGGVPAIQQINEDKAAKLYAAIDGTDFYRGTADPAHRSLMNVTFRLPTEDREAAFVNEADAAGMRALKGHRSVGGIRASIYNAFPAKGVDALIDFMQEFEKKNG